MQRTNQFERRRCPQRRLLANLFKSSLAKKEALSEPRARLWAAHCGIQIAARQPLKHGSSWQIPSNDTHRWSSSTLVWPLIGAVILTANCQIALSQAPEHGTSSSASSVPVPNDSNQIPSTIAACFGGLQTFEKISMSSFENPAGLNSGSFSSGTLVQQDDQALTSECINLCRSQQNCLSFVIDYNKFECKSYATTQQELQQEFDSKFQAARSANATATNQTTELNQSSSTVHFQHLLPSASSNYFEKICLDGVANRNQFADVCGSNRLWTIERVVDSFLDGYVDKEVTNVNSKDECSKLCIFETQFVCRSADYDQPSRLCRLSKEDRRTQPQAMRYSPGSDRHYLENQCATPGPSSCVYETKKNVAVISMDALKFAQTSQDCQMKCNLESTFNCRSYSFHQQRCFLSGDDSASLNSNLIKLPPKQGWQFGEKKCLVELCTKGIFSYEKITGYTLRSALSTPMDLMMAGGSSLSMPGSGGSNLDDPEKMHHESSQQKLRHLLPGINPRTANGSSNLVASMMMMAANSDSIFSLGEQLEESASSLRHSRGTPDNNLAITNKCRQSCDLGYLNCPAFTIDYKNNRCQRLDRNSQGRHLELVARQGVSYYEKICLRVPEMLSMCQDKYWIYERVIGYELAPRLYDKSVKFVQSRRDCEEYCLEEKKFQCRSALYNDETSDCKLSRFDRRLASNEGAYYRNFNPRVSYLENQCIRDQDPEQPRLQCYYEQTKEEPSYPTYTELIEMVPPQNSAESGPTSGEQNVDPYHATTAHQTRPAAGNGTGVSQHRYGASYCEQLCNSNEKFQCRSFGYYASTAQCFLSGDDFVSAGEMSSSPSTGFSYFEKKCRLSPMGSTGFDDKPPANDTSPPQSDTTDPHNLNPYTQPPSMHVGSSNDAQINPQHSPQQPMTTISTTDQPNKSAQAPTNLETSTNPDRYKCGTGHTFAYQRISGFEPIGGYLTVLIKDNNHPGIVGECASLCKKAFECRAFVVDYANNQCFAMVENSAAGLLSLRQSIGKDYFEGFCIPEHTLLANGGLCVNKTWQMDKIVDQAAVGVQHQKLISNSNRVQCRLACLDERLFRCKSAMFDSGSAECKLYSVDRESILQMRLVFTKGVDFYENQCHITSSLCPYDAIERDMTIVTSAKSILTQSNFDCEQACNNELSFNCRSYTYLEQYSGLPNFCLLSPDSRSTSQRGSVKERPRALYAERNCYYRRARFPGGGPSVKPAASPATEMAFSPPGQPKAPGGYSTPSSAYLQGSLDPYKLPATGSRPITSGLHSNDVLPHPSSPQSGPSVGEPSGGSLDVGNAEIGLALGQGCEPHQYTFERTFGYDYRLGQKERAAIPPSVGIAIACQQECLRRGLRCRSFVVDYSLPFQSCFLIETQVGANKRLLVKSANSAYFEKICLPRAVLDSPEPITATHAQLMNTDHSMDIAPSYSHEPWGSPVSPPTPNQLPYYMQQQQQQLLQHHPSRSCAKLWTFERFLNHNFTAPVDKVLENALTRTECEAACLNEVNFACRAATYDYESKVCRLFKNTRRTVMSQFVDLQTSSSASQVIGSTDTASPSQPAEVIGETGEIPKAAATSILRNNTSVGPSSRQISAETIKNIDYLENNCMPEPSSCQYRQLYDMFSPYIEKISHAVSLGDCQRQCDLERLFICKSINYEPSTRNCMLINEDLISLDRGQQGSLLPRKNSIYSEKGNCEMISVQCTSQEMLVTINFDAPFRGRVLAKGNPDQCSIVGDGQTSIQFPIVFGPKCNSRQEGHNTFVNEIVIQQHPVIMTDSDKTVRVMCAFEAPDQTITLKNPSSHDNKSIGIDVAQDGGRTRHDKQQFNSVVSNKAAPPSLLLRILDQSGRDASMINLGDDLVLKIQMQMTENQDSALGIFARNLAARSSNGESLLLIDNDGCPVDPTVFPGLDLDPRDGKSLYSPFKAFRFPSSGLVNFEVQIRFCPERCQPVDCQRGNQRLKSYGRKKREVEETSASSEETHSATGDIEPERQPVLQSVHSNQQPSPQPIASANPLDALSTVMKPGRAFQHVRELMLPTATKEADTTPDVSPNQGAGPSTVGTDESTATDSSESQTPAVQFGGTGRAKIDSQSDSSIANQSDSDRIEPPAVMLGPSFSHQQPVSSLVEPHNQKSILLHVNEKIVPSTTSLVNHLPSSPTSGQQHTLAPYAGRLPFPEVEQFPHKRQQNIVSLPTTPMPPTILPSHTPTMLPPSTPSPPETISSNQTNISTSSPTVTELSSPHNNIDEMTTPDSEANKGQTLSSRDLPLRFSILVGENQASNMANNGWSPSKPMLVVNSSNVDLDHVVVPGKGGGHFDATTDPQAVHAPRDQHQDDSNVNSNLPTIGPELLKTSLSSDANGVTSNRLYEQTFDAQPSNSIAVQDNHAPQTGTAESRRQATSVGHGELAASSSRDCQVEVGAGRFKTIIWTGSLVIGLNMSLVVLSLVLYFKRNHLRQRRHTIVRATSNYGTNSNQTGRRVGFSWMSKGVQLKAKTNLSSGTSLNTHEHFFCKLNSNPSGRLGDGIVGGGGVTDLNWPNLSASSSHSTISSMAAAGSVGPLPVTSIKINPTRLTPFDQTLANSGFGSSASDYGKLNGSTTISTAGLDDSYDFRETNNLHSTYTSNLSTTQPNRFFKGDHLM